MYSTQLSTLSAMVNTCTPSSIQALHHDDDKNGIGVSVYQDGQHITSVYVVDRDLWCDEQVQDVFDIIDAFRFIQSKIKN